MDFIRRLTQLVGNDDEDERVEKIEEKRPARPDKKENRKKISVLVPVFNEYDNIVPLSVEITDQLKQLEKYDYELVFIDNSSTDGTRDLIQMLCHRDKKIKAIFNSNNFGRLNSQYYGICQCGGDCVICMSGDFQEPTEMIPKFVKEWESGYAVVCGIKLTYNDNVFVRKLKKLYSRMLNKMSSVEQIDNFTGFGLYDRSFIELLRRLDDPMPFLRGMVAELGYDRIDIPYEQQERRSGKSHNTVSSLYDAGMLGFTTYTKTGPRFAAIFGFICSVLSIIAGIVCLLLWLLKGISFENEAVLLAVCVFGSLQIFFIGLVGEYVINILGRTRRRPLVIEEKRINFDD